MATTRRVLEEILKYSAWKRYYTLKDDTLKISLKYSVLLGYLLKKPAHDLKAMHVILLFPLYTYVCTMPLYSFAKHNTNDNISITNTIIYNFQLFFAGSYSQSRLNTNVFE